MNFLDKTEMLAKIGFRNVIRQRRRSLLIVSSAAAGVIGILFTAALINSFFLAMMENGIKSGLGHVQIRPAGYEKSRKMGMILENPSEIQKKIEKDGATSFFYSGRFEKEGLLRIGSFTQGVLFIGIDPESEKNVSLYSSWIDEGNFIDENGSFSSGVIPCLIGRINADKMEVAAGDWAVLSLSDHAGIYRSLRCSIAGIFASSIEPVDKMTVILNREHLSRFYAEDSSLHSYFVFLGESMNNAESIKANLKTTLQSEENIEILSFNDLEKYFAGTMEIMDSFTWIFYLILLIGVALILFDSITMSVFERMREIGIIHAVGTSPIFIFTMIIYESILLTLTGSAVGLITGGCIILYFNIYGMDLSYFSQGMESIGKLGSTVYPYITIRNAVESLIFPLIISVLSAVFPAIKALRISPVRAIYNR